MADSLLPSNNLPIQRDVSELHRSDNLPSADVSHNIFIDGNASNIPAGIDIEGKSYYDYTQEHYTVTKTVITETNNINTQVTLADVWYIKEEVDYERRDSGEQQDEGYPTTSNEEDNSIHDFNVERGYVGSHQNEFENIAIDYVRRHGWKRNGIEERRAIDPSIDNSGTNSIKGQYLFNNITHTINKTTQTINFISTPQPKEEKINEDTEPNFVTIFRKPEYEQNRSNILSVDEWLFEIMQNNTSTANMIDFMKYLLNCAVGSNMFEVPEGFSLSTYNPSNFNNITSSAEGQFAIHTTIFTKDVFKQALQAYWDSGRAPEAFKTNFLDRADTLYDASVANNINPELVVITARSENQFRETHGKRNNYWGLDCRNEEPSSGLEFDSFEEGIVGYAQYIAKYEDPSMWYYDAIMQNYQERSSLGCDPLGYGLPGTLSGMQSLFSDLGRHVEGNGDVGGYYYMDPDRAGVTKIYATHEDFINKCRNAGGEHAYGTNVTAWENGQYTAWQVEQKIKIWNEIFGNFGSINSTNVSQSTTGVANGTLDQKMAYLFPNGVPTNESQISNYITSVEVAMTDKNGKKYTGTIKIHKSLASDVQEVFQNAQNAGFKIYDASGYGGFRIKNNGTGSGTSHHSYGVAIDINVNENYMIKKGSVMAGSFWDPSRSEYSIPKDGVLVKAFEAKGWTWGGNWTSSKDYMHFSFTGQ